MAAVARELGVKALVCMSQMTVFQHSQTMMLVSIDNSEI